MGSITSKTEVIPQNTPKRHTALEKTTEIQPITAENVQKLFPGTVGYLEEPKPETETMVKKDLQGHEQKQVKAMAEVCILLDTNDAPIGGADKYLCHQMANIKRGLLHRAFSVFLFDSQNRLLLQQRADGKITYPDMWTNTCCSHPLNFPAEGGIELKDAVLGAKRAAMRKLWDEVRIKPGPEGPEAFLEKFNFLTRIIYQAVNVSPRETIGEETWGEHEIDYILFIKTDIAHTANPDEAKATRYVTQEELKEMMEDKSLKFTPWFELICRKELYKWWDRLATGEEITSKDEKDRVMQMLEE